MVLILHTIRVFIRRMEKIMASGYIKPTTRDWFDMIFGTLLGTALYGALGAVLLKKLAAPEGSIWIYVALVFIFIVYGYSRDTKFIIVKTGLPKNENLNMLRGVFNQLDWSTLERPEWILVGENKYLLRFIYARVVYSDDFIGYNFQYGSGTKAGRPAFFIGIRSVLKMQFESKLKSFNQSK